MSQKISRILAVAVALSAIAAAAQTTGPTTQTTDVVKITLHPVATSQPALQYPLLPPMTERRPGNAAVQYMIAANMLPPQPPDEDHHDKTWKVWDEIDQQFDAPIDTFDPKIAADIVDHISFRFIDTAARRDHANWDVDFRGAGLYALLPQLNYMRVMANAVTVRSRLEIFCRDWVAADQSLQSDFAMSWHLNDEPVTVQSMVACGISQLTLTKGVNDWISRGGPNLYWSLTTLPPMVNLPAVADAERAVIPLTDPLFESALAGSLRSDQWRTTLERVLQRLAPDFTEDGHLSTAEISTRYDALLKSTYPRATARMRSKGMSTDQIAAVAEDRAVGEFIFQEYREISDELWKGWALPFPEAAPLLRSGRDALNQAKHDGNPLLTWVPDIYKGRETLVRADQHLAALRVIEAIRDYAARHQGKLPMTLADITALPIPLDPVTGKPFGYQLRRATAVLTPAALEDSRHPNVSYELEIR